MSPKVKTNSCSRIICLTVIALGFLVLRAFDLGGKSRWRETVSTNRGKSYEKVLRFGGRSIFVNRLYLIGRGRNKDRSRRGPKRGGIYPRERRCKRRSDILGRFSSNHRK